MSIANTIAPYGKGELDDKWDDILDSTGRVRRLRGRLAVPNPSPEHERYAYGHEVKVTAGVCATWRCGRTVFDWCNHRECGEHASEPLPKDTRDRTAEYEARKQREASDSEWAERERARRREASRKSRLDPAYRDKHNARKRAKRAAMTGAAS